jgi:uncharacterized protein
MKNMRRTDRQMEKSQAWELLKKTEYGVLSTVDQNNHPYGTPLSYTYMDDVIYFHCAVEGSKLDNITHNSNICFTVVGPTNVLSGEFTTNYESVMVFGEASIVEDQVEKTKALMELVKKYSPAFMEKGAAYIQKAQERTTVVKIVIGSITGKHRK